jgi:hypothetical protein
MLATVAGLAIGAAVGVGGATQQPSEVSAGTRRRGTILAWVVLGLVVAGTVLPLSAASLDWWAAQQRGTDLKSASATQWRAFRAVPSLDRMVRSAADADGAHGDAAARARLRAAMVRGPLRNDLGAWEAVYDIAPTWHAAALQQQALEAEHRLDPLVHQAPQRRKNA